MRKPFQKPTVMAVLLTGLLGSSAAWAGATDMYWHEDAGRSLSPDAPQPAQYRALSLETSQITTYLRQAHASGVATAVSMPLPEGGFAEFMVVDSGTMPIELQKKYPGILSFKGVDGEGRRLRLDVSPLGFQAMVFDKAGSWLVRPEVVASGSDRYLSYRRSEVERPDGFGQCEVHGKTESIDHIGEGNAPMAQTGVQKRVYRTAVAANNKYITAVGGGTAAGGLAATVAAVNRVTEVYEYEMSIQLTLVPNNDLIMYPTAGSDPFSSNGTGVINNSTTVISAAIGAGNYDIGHVFTTGSGGVAGLGVVCSSSSKARGTTGLPNPTGDDFYIDFVAHEMGHQFGGNHPFNGANGNCSGGNRNGSTAYEPGSGSTVMAYAGICGADDLQPHSDPYFHAISLQEITNYTNGGGNCSVNTPNTNQAPVINTANLPTGLTIPARTPFVLSGTATDADPGSTLGYSWEEWDLGPQAALTAGDNGSSPIFRSFSPKATGERVFPSMSTVLGGAAIKGETLPTTNRTLKFRLTVRDHSDDLHGWGTSQSADIALTVANSAGPFKVTAPAGGLVWSGGGSASVVWDVANTNVAPVNCPNVDIRLSTDGGQTFPTTIASGVPNNGSATVSVPAVSTTQARVSVSCATNVFFNVSPANFTIAPGGTVYTVGGTLSGLASGSAVTLRLNNGNDLPLSANGAFTFSGSLLSGTTYAVTVGTQPSNPPQSCTITNGSGTMGSANVTNVNVSCVTLPTYTIGGTVSGLAGSGLTLSLNGGTPQAISANGPFTLAGSLLSGASYAVTVGTQPSSPLQNCTVTNGSSTVGNTNVTNVNVNCVTLVTYTIGGTVSGYTGSGLKLKLNGGNEQAIAASGPFTFASPLVDGSPYAVAISAQPPGQTCTLANGSGTVSGANVTNVAVNCADLPPAAHTVGGRVRGLTSPGLVLQLNGGVTITQNTNGLYAFYPGVSTGQAYAVAVLTQPAGLECVVSNPTGTMGNVNVTNVDVDCAPPAPDDTIFKDGFESDATGTCTPVQLFQDPGFEATVDFENPFWASTDTLGGTSFCDDSCDDAGEFVARTGEWFTWFGGWDQANQASLSQSVVLPAGSPRWFNYWLVNQIGGDTTASLTLSIDGTVVTTITPASGQSDWASQSFQIPSQYLDGQSHAIRFDWTASAPGAAVGGAMIDDVTLDCAQGSGARAPSPLAQGTVARKHGR